MYHVTSEKSDQILGHSTRGGAIATTVTLGTPLVEVVACNVCAPQRTGDVAWPSTSHQGIDRPPKTFGGYISLPYGKVFRHRSLTAPS